MIGILLEEERTHRYTQRRPRDNGGRDVCDVPTSQGILRIASPTGSEESGMEQIFPQSPKGTNSADTSISDFWSPELTGNTFLLF